MIESSRRKKTRGWKQHDSYISQAVQLFIATPAHSRTCALSLSSIQKERLLLRLRPVFPLLLPCFALLYFSSLPPIPMYLSLPFFFSLFLSFSFLLSLRVYTLYVLSVSFLSLSPLLLFFYQLDALFFHLFLFPEDQNVLFLSLTITKFCSTPDSHSSFLSFSCAYLAYTIVGMERTREGTRSYSRAPPLCQLSQLIPRHHSATAAQRTR